MNKKVLWLWSGIAVCIFALMVAVGKLTDKAVYAYSASTRDSKVPCIVIDAGHGGVDGGAVSCTGKYESHINLDIALRLNDLMQLLGFRTKMIRTEDVSVYTEGDTIAEKKVSDLKERVRIVKNTDNAILISIHQNYFQDSYFDGAQVFYCGDNGEFAKLLQANFVSTINTGSNRKAKNAKGIYLMEKTKCPGVLVECGFLSNPTEAVRLAEPDYQKKICCVIAATISSYAYRNSALVA